MHSNVSSSNQIFHSVEGAGDSNGSINNASAAPAKAKISGSGSAVILLDRLNDSHSQHSSTDYAEKGGGANENGGHQMLLGHQRPLCVSFHPTPPPPIGNSSNHHTSCFKRNGSR
jgi:hypothetical protein